MTTTGYRKKTSGQAYHEGKASGKFTLMQYQVYQAIEYLGQCTDKAIARHLQLPINSITGRRGELVAAGKVVEAGRFQCPETGRQVTFWKVYEPQQLQLF